MAKRNRLLPRLRSRNHEWLLRTVRAGSAVIVLALTGGGVLAASHGKQASGLWEIALAGIVALAVLGIAALVVGGVGAFLTRPVSENHAATLKASALAVRRSLESSVACDYGDGYKPDQAFCAHFRTLSKRLAAWDAVVAGPTVAERVLDQQLDAMMAEHKIPDVEAGVGYVVEPIKKYAYLVAMERANGRLLEAPHFEWRMFTTAGHQEIPGSPYGVLMVSGSNTDWISLRPLDSETEDDWLARAAPYRQRVDAFMAAAYERALPYAQAVLDAEQRLEDFKRGELPAILDALELICAREAPRARPRLCDSC